ncbi:MAG: AI-2E family transporter [Thermoguttaceae bacterium]
MRHIAWTTFLVLATLTVLAIVWQFLEAVVIFLLALTLAVILLPAVEALQRRGWPRIAAAAAVYLACLFLGAALAFPLGSLGLQEVQRAITDFGAVYTHIDQQWAQGNAFQQLIAERLPRLEDVPKTLADLPRPMLVEHLFSLSQGLLGLLVSAGVIFVLSFYWTVDSQRFERLWLSLLALDERTRAWAAWQKIETEVGAYMRSELLQSLIAGIVLALMFGAVGFPYPVLIAVIAALAWLVPWLGPALAVAAVWLAVALNSIEATPLANLTRGIVGSGFVLGVFTVLELFVEPRLVQRRKYSSLLVVLIVLGLIDLVGIAGIILGPPVAVTVQILLNHYFWQTPAEPESMPLEDLSVLKQRIAEVRQDLQETDEAWTVQMESILDRLGALLDEARGSLPGAQPPATSSSTGRS